MAAKELIRDYRMDDAKLSTEATRIKGNVKRDLAYFKSRNIDEPNLASLQAAIDDFDNYPTDEELQGNVTEATAAKDAIANDIHMQIRPIRNMAELQYKTTGGHYRTFGFSNLNRLNDNNLYRMVLRVVRVGTKLLPELAGRGLTATALSDLAAKGVSFHDALETQAELVEDRDLATQERVRLGNVLYAIVVELASVGKSLYEDKDEARYNDYVLYDDAATGSTAATPLPKGDQ